MNVAVFGGTCYIKLHIHGERKQKHHATVLKQKKKKSKKRNPEAFLPIVGFLISEKQFFLGFMVSYLFGWKPTEFFTC